MLYLILLVTTVLLKPTVEGYSELGEDDINTGVNVLPLDTTGASQNESTQDSAATAPGSVGKTVQHPYYTEKLLVREDVEGFLRYWVDIDALLGNNRKSNKTHGLKKHSRLSDAYRRAVSVGLTNFKFPYYGLDTDNITIAVGGFLYMGHAMHSWLAATQYIAPFMANFQTAGEPKSGIIFVETEDFLAVEWRDVTLRGQSSSGFTFQARLEKNGDIYFAYKKIPIKYEAVSDQFHPKKAGISDAYSTDSVLNRKDTKRIIYEYARVDIQSSLISNYTVIKLEARETCLSIKDPVECVTANLPDFNCTWCGPSCFDPKSFCSDSDGSNRRRQDFKKYKCGSFKVSRAAIIAKKASCEVEAEQSSSDSSSSKEETKEEDDQGQGSSSSKEEAKEEDDEDQGSGHSSAAYDSSEDESSNKSAKDPDEDLNLFVANLLKDLSALRPNLRNKATKQIKDLMNEFKRSHE